METILATDTIEDIYYKLDKSLFDVFFDKENNDFYFSDGLDIGKIKKVDKNLIVVSMVTKTGLLTFCSCSKFSLSNLDKVLDRKQYEEVDVEDFYPNATVWLKSNGKLVHVKNNLNEVSEN